MFYHGAHLALEEMSRAAHSLKTGIWQTDEADLMGVSQSVFTWSWISFKETGSPAKQYSRRSRS